MAPAQLKFVPYIPLASLDPREGSASTSEPLPKRARGRPKGSKNKTKNSSLTDSVHASSSGGNKSHPSATLTVEALGNMVMPADIPLHSHPGTAQHPVDVQTPFSTENENLSAAMPASASATSRGHGHVDEVCVQPNADPNSGALQNAVNMPSQHSSSAMGANVPTVVLSTSGGRGVIDRARVQPDTTPNPVSATPLPSLLTTSDMSPLGFITDVDNEDDLSSFLSSGIGEENEEDGETDKNAPGSDARVTFPEWFQKRLRTLLDELKEDLKSTVKQSRYYQSGQFWIRASSIWSSLKGATLKPTDLFAPDFFLWDPLNLLGKTHALRCPMPDCNHHLTRSGVVDRPRRVVDIDSTFWLIGYTYECQKAAKGCGSRFRSWDQQILQRLPRALAAEFPAHLTWRSGLSTRAFGVVRSCFQHGMGSEEVADMFRMQHLRRYDELRLQYLRTKIKQMGFSAVYEPFLPFEDRSSQGFHGFTPSGQWLRDMYDEFIESHRDTLGNVGETTSVLTDPFLELFLELFLQIKNLVMPAATRRSERAKKLLKFFIRNNKECQRRALLRRRAIRRARLDNVLPQHPFGIDLDLDL
ncbi:hypothetical protein K438DRAFT_1941745 [Mycena galopus ATCC 62051]|nr:hypothetical protein K438DRAFT_1941745 [Mycena galopus ATCC 62051]